MKDANGRLSISEGSFPTVGWKVKVADEYDG
jgi:hypothetical protein